MGAEMIPRDPPSWDNAYQFCPFFAIPSHWLVQFIPPTNGAAMRFQVRHKYKPNMKPISVYADFDGNLGAVTHPYWEIYPDFVGDNWRCSLPETERLVAAINLALETA